MFLTFKFQVVPLLLHVAGVDLSEGVRVVFILLRAFHLGLVAFTGAALVLLPTAHPLAHVEEDGRVVVRTRRHDIVVGPHRRVEIFCFVLELHGLIRSALHRLLRRANIRAHSIGLACPQEIAFSNLAPNLGHQISHVRRVHRHIMAASHKILEEYLK